MKSKLRKTIIISLSTIGVLIAVLIVLPFAFKGKLMEIAKKELNKQLTADVDFESLNISIIRNFPNASISLKKLYVAGRDEFAGDTLLLSNNINLVVNLKSLFSGSDYEVKRFLMKDSKIFAHELSDGRVNWDILPPDSAAVETTSSAFTLKLQDIQMLNTDIIYVSDTSRIAAKLQNSNIKLKGDFSADHTQLNTDLSIDSLSFWSDGVQYAHKLQFGFNADIDAYLNENRYVLQNNSMNINAIPLSLDGWVKLLDEGMEMDLKLNAAKVDFKSLLSLVPAIYSNSFDKLTADGNVSLNGFLKGKYIDESYPEFDLSLTVENGRFRYPDLPKSVENVQISSRIVNPGGSLDNTIIDVSGLKFSLGGNPFAAQLHVSQPMSDPNFRLNADGKLDLGMIKDIYPLEKGTELNGVLNMDINASGRMSFVEQNRYDDFKFGGTLNVKNMLLEMNELPKSVEVKNADLLFNDRYLNLSELDMKLGENDFRLNGKVENYLPYALRNKTLKGEMTLQSNHLNLNDFMGEYNSADTTSLQIIEVPKNLNLTLNGKISDLQYAEMRLKDTEAQFYIANGVLSIQKMNTNAFGGTMELNGSYNTSNLAQPGIDFDLDLKQISFAEIFSQVESLRKFAPIFEKVAGQFNAKLSLNSLLAGDMMPVLSSVLSQGNFKAEMLTLKEDVTALNELASALKIEKLSNFSLKDFAMAFEIKDGKLSTKPFDLKIKDYSLKLGGSTSLDQSIDYTGTINLPDKLNLGKFQQIGFKIGGNFSKPKIELDLKNTLNALIDGEIEKTMQKADSVKTQLIEKGEAEIEKALQQAQKQADQIIEQARLQSDLLVNQAKAQGDSLVSKAKNPIAKELARKGADELVKQAQKQADEINNKAKAEADKVILKAKEKM